MGHLRKALLLLTAISACLAQSGYRLDHTVIPSHYDLTLTLLPDFGETAVFTGRVEITLSASETTSSFSVLLNNIEVDSVTLYAASDSTQANLTSSTSRNTTVHKLQVTSTTALQPGSNYVLAVEYSGILGDDMAGFYRSSYVDANGTTKWLATTQFQTTSARRAFPCFDEPGLKATFNVVIIRPQALHAVSCAPLISSETYDATLGLVRDTFQTTPVMSTYLLAFIVSDFASLRNDAINYGVYSASHLIDTAHYAFEVGPKLVTAFEDFIEFPYMSSGIGKLDQFAIPDFSAGAMENWGLITYRESRLLYDTDESTFNDKKVIAAVIAHELAHMWFGNLVTCDWWAYTWLNEGFARYFQYFGTAWVETEMELDSVFVLEQQQVIFASDASTSSASLNVDCNSPSEISGKFSSISYNKGASIIRMIKHVLGYDNWKNGLVDYIAARQFSTALPEHLYSGWRNYSSSANLPADIEVIMTNWTELGGFPVVKVSLSGSDAILSQEQFLLNSSASSTREWYIPITYTTSHEYNFDNVTPSYWLIPGQDVTIPNVLHGGTGWVLLNLQESGYYRVTYDDELWSQLASGLKKENFDSIPPLNRAQIVDDALTLARAGRLSYSTALDVVSYLASDTDFYPWYSAFTAFTYLRRRIGTHETLGSNFQNHVLALMGNLYNSVTFDRIPGESYVEAQKKALALNWACTLEYPDCLEKASQLYSDLRNNGQAINPDVRSVVYCTALRHSDDPQDWYFLWNKFLQNTLATEDTIILSALGCSRNQTLLNEYMTLALNRSNGIRRQDVSSVFAAVYGSNPEGISITLEYVKGNYQRIIDYFGSTSTLLTILSNVATRMTTEEEVADLEAWVDSNEESLSSVASSVRSYATSARAELAWTETYTAELTSYYSSFFSDGSSSDIATISTALLALMFSLILANTGIADRLVD